EKAGDRAEAGERRLLEENYGIQIKLADTMPGHDPAGLLGDLLNRLRPEPDGADLRGFEWHYLWNLASRELHLRGHRTSVWAVAISPDGTVCASGDNDGAIILWDMRTGKILKEWQPRVHPISGMAFSRDGQTLATNSGTRDGRYELSVWEVATTIEVARLEVDSKPGGPAGQGRTIDPDGT